MRMSHFGKRVALCLSVAALLACGEALAFGNMTGGGSGAAKAPATSEPIRVEKAKGENAYTVGELYEKSAALDKKTVTVRGKVVKVSKMIMGKNWVHLRDGSGDPAKGTNNIVVTSQGDPKTGDVVTARGTLHKDKDFGAGYKYPVILEEGTFQK